MLGTETGQNPDRPIGNGAVGTEHDGVLLAFGESTKPLDRLVVVVGQHHRARTAVVAARQRTPDGLQRRRPTLRTVDPIRELGGSGLLARGQESRNCKRYKRCGGLFILGRGKLLTGDGQQAQRLVGQPGQFGFVINRRDGLVQRVIVIVIVIVMDELAVLVHPDPADILRRPVGLRSHLDDRFRLGFDEIARQHLAQHQVCIGAAETETGNPGDGFAAVAGPIGDCVDDLEVFLVEVDVRVRAGVVDRRRDLVVAQRQRHFGEACRTCSRF